METGNVYELIAKVQGALAQKGIRKDHKNTQQHYSFRGIDDVYNALAPLLASNGLVILPNVISREVSERETKSGGVLFYVCVGVRFDFVSSTDGSTHAVTTYGEAMDSGDKATNKAMSAAYKYACFLTFCIPTEGDNDADATTPDPKAQAKQPEQPTDEDVATDKQLKFARSLAKASVITDDERTELENQIEAGLSKSGCKRWIDWLQAKTKSRKEVLQNEGA